MSKKGPLNEGILRAVADQFDRLKQGEGYGNYVIGDYIDSGGFARVYAVNPLRGGGVKYALRIADERDNENELKHQREMNAVKSLMAEGQKHIVESLMNFTAETTFGEEKHTLYCTLMPFLSPLSKIQSKSDDQEIAVRLGNDLLPLLQTCMKNRILHRDVKPQNIFYDGDFRNTAGFLLGDFGEARWDVDGSVTPVVSWATVSPEIFERRHEHRLCDMYSLGVVMYYFLNDRKYPFDNNHRKRLDTRGALPAPKYGSSELKALIVKATQYDPSARFSSPQKMLEALKRCKEYQWFVADGGMQSAETIVPRDDTREENARLLRELAEREKRHRAEMAALQEQVEQLRRQLASSVGGAASERPVKEPFGRRESASLTVKVGGRLQFGQYPQGANGEVQPLIWRVLTVESGRALLITEDLIDAVPYNEKYKDVTWETCTLRKWMNDEFLIKAFGSKEPSRVLQTLNQNPENPGFGTKGGNVTRDRVFALSIEEATRYFSNDNDRMAAPTAYAIKRGAYASNDYSLKNGRKTGWWWLRSPGSLSSYAAIVISGGNISQNGSYVNLDIVAVRPAFWLNL